MDKKIKSIYRSVGSKNIVLTEGLALEGIHDGFVFSDFQKQKTFTIPAELHSVITSEDVLNLSFITPNKTNWESTLREDYEFGFTIIKNEIEHKKINKAWFLSFSCKIFELNSAINTAINTLNIFFLKLPKLFSSLMSSKYCKDFLGLYIALILSCFKGSKKVMLFFGFFDLTPLIINVCKPFFSVNNLAIIELSPCFI